MGATDSHSVNDPVGQARTYLKSSTDDVTKIDRKEVYRAFLEGRATVAAGIFANLSIAKQYSTGDLVPASVATDKTRNQGPTFTASLRVAAPSWVRPREAMIYVNGKQVAKKSINALPNQLTDQTLTFTIDRPTHDAHVVAFVLGDDITLPGWTTYGKSTQAITNPIFLDIDGDLKYSAPRNTAKKLIAKHQGQSDKLTPDQQKTLLDSPAVKSDSAVLLHVKDLLK